MLPGLEQVRQSVAARRLLGWRSRPATVLRLEFGRGEASILAEVRDDGRARLRFGSGEEFVGPCDEMPVSVIRGAREALAAAGEWVRRAPRAGGPGEGGVVRVFADLGDEEREAQVALADLRAGDSVHEPLWRAFTSWLGALLVVLFGDEPSRGSLDESPALSRARALCRLPR